MAACRGVAEARRDSGREARFRASGRHSVRGEEPNPMNKLMSGLAIAAIASSAFVGAASAQRNCRQWEWWRFDFRQQWRLGQCRVDQHWRHHWLDQRCQCRIVVGERGHCCRDHRRGPCSAVRRLIAKLRRRNRRPARIGPVFFVCRSASRLACSPDDPVLPVRSYRYSRHRICTVLSYRSSSVSAGAHDR